MRQLLSLLVAMLVVSGSALASPPKYDPKRSFLITGIIRGSSLDDAATALDKFTTEKSTSKLVDLLIDSPGGSVMTGFQFVSYMKAFQAAGGSIRCTVSSMAASMAFQILTHCNGGRHVLAESFLLWHRARVQVGGMFGAVLTAPAAYVLYDQLQEIDSQIYNDLLSSVGRTMAEEDLSRHFEAESLHLGSSLCSEAKAGPRFCTSWDAIPGLFQVMATLAKSIPRKDADPFGILPVFPGQGEIVYIAPDYILRTIAPDLVLQK